MARGLSNAQIASSMHFAEAAVERHLANVYQKIGVGCRSGAVRMALMEQRIGLRDHPRGPLLGWLRPGCHPGRLSALIGAH